jgi:hypothetical protein
MRDCFRASEGIEQHNLTRRVGSGQPLPEVQSRGFGGESPATPLEVNDNPRAKFARHDMYSAPRVDQHVFSLPRGEDS